MSVPTQDNQRSTKNNNYLLLSLKDISKVIGGWVWRITARDFYCVLIIIIFASALRFPFIDRPYEAQYDEGAYIDFAIHMVSGKPFFEAHPPLARIIFAEITRQNLPFTTEHLPLVPGSGRPFFGDFPYIEIRLIIACFGILLPLIAYAIGRILHYSPRWALLPAFFIIFDNALVIYSRAILPDIIQLVFGFLALFFAFASTRSRDPRMTKILVVCTGVFAGFALSVKWSALGMLASIALIFVLYRNYRAVIASGMIALITYIAVFLIPPLVYFPEGGMSDGFQFAYDVPIAKIEYPASHSPRELSQFFGVYHNAMYQFNSDPEFIKSIPKASGVLSWPIANNSLLYYQEEHGYKRIVFAGNTFLYVFSFCALLFNLIWIFVQFKRKKTLPIGKDEAILLFAYVMNYLPFFLVERPMYAHNYFTAFILLLLLLPKILPRMRDFIGDITHNRLVANVLIFSIPFFVVLSFFLALPTTYGF